MHPGDREILDDFSRTRETTIELLRRVPAELLRRVPAGCEQSIGWEFFHIADAIAGWMAWCMGDGGPADLEMTDDREVLLRQLAETRGRLLEYFTRDGGEAMGARFTPQSPSFPERVYDFTGRNRVVYLTGHEAHHRAKIVLAVRQFGFSDIPFIPFPHALLEGGVASRVGSEGPAVS